MSVRGKNGAQLDAHPLSKAPAGAWSTRSAAGRLVIGPKFPLTASEVTRQKAPSRVGERVRLLLLSTPSSRARRVVCPCGSAMALLAVAARFSGSPLWQKRLRCSEESKRFASFSQIGRVSLRLPFSQCRRRSPAHLLAPRARDGCAARDSQRSAPPTRSPPEWCIAGLASARWY